MKYSYEDDAGGIRADRELNEGLSLTSSNQNQLFWDALPTATETQVAALNAKKVKVSMPLYSGI